MLLVPLVQEIIRAAPIGSTVVIYADYNTDDSYVDLLHLSTYMHYYHYDY